MKTVNEELIARSSVLSLLEVFPFDGDVHDMERIEDEVKEIPSVDVVRHGYWEDCEGGRCRCSCCHALKEQYYDSFCSNCGAKMDEGGEQK